MAKSIRANDDEGNLQTFTVGDCVGFKNDIEQSGVIVGFYGTSLVLVPCGEGFEGDYIADLEKVTVRASDCWVD